MCDVGWPHPHWDTGAHIGVELCINAYLKVNSYWIWIHSLWLPSWDPHSKLMLFRGWQQIICRTASNKTSCTPSNIRLLISFFLPYPELILHTTCFNCLLTPVAQTWILEHFSCWFLVAFLLIHSTKFFIFLHSACCIILTEEGSRNGGIS